MVYFMVHTSTFVKTVVYRLSAFYLKKQCTWDHFENVSDLAVITVFNLYSINRLIKNTLKNKNIKQNTQKANNVHALIASCKYNYIKANKNQHKLIINTLM